MKRLLRRSFGLALCLALLFAATACAAPVKATPNNLNVAQLITRNTPLNLTPYEGKTIVLNFFTQWCAYCMQEMPDLRDVNDLYDPEALQVVMIHAWDGENASATEAVKAQFDMGHMTFFEDEDLSVVRFSGLRGYPATIIIKPDGNMALAANYMVDKALLTETLDGLGVPRKAEDASEPV
jgi:thiol-disulfide isomerase/thioredoxin